MCVGMVILPLKYKYSRLFDPSHMYFRDEGMYTVNAFAFDSSVTLEAKLPVVIADIPCDMPEVSIIDARTAMPMASVFIRSVSISHEARTEVKCNKTVTVW